MENNNPQMNRELWAQSLAYSQQLLASCPEYSREKTIQGIRGMFAQWGALEGLRLKNSGLMSREFEDYFLSLAKNIDLEIKFTEPLKLPFVGAKGKLRSANPLPHQITIWTAYTSQLLSTYAMKPLVVKCVSDKSPSGVFELIVEESIEPAREFESGLNPSLLKDFKHSLNNYLGGIISLISLLQKEQPQNEKLDLIMESAQNINKLSNKTFPK